MQLNPSEISDLIRTKIQNLDVGAQVRTQGTVVSLTDGICRVHGLSDAMQGEMLEFPDNTFGLALNLERDSVGAVILGKYEHISEGDTVKCTGRILEVPVGPELIGRVVDALGQPIDGKGPINAKEKDVIEKVAPGVMWRQSVAQPVQTGLKSIDAMVPIGRGQRELIIGDRQTGKTAVAIDTIINQKGKDLFCVYVAIGQKASSIMNVVKKLEEHGAMEYTIVVAASASGVGGDAIYRAVFRLLHGRILSRSRAGRADHLRRSDQAGVGVPSDLAAAPPPSRTRGIPGRRFLPALAAAGARGTLQSGVGGALHQRRGERQDGFADRASYHRNAGGRRDRVRADQRDFDHRRTDLSGDRSFQRRHPAGDQRRHFGVARRRRGSDQGDQEAGRRRASVAGAVSRARRVCPVRVRSR